MRPLRGTQQAKRGGGFGLGALARSSSRKEPIVRRTRGGQASPAPKKALRAERGRWRARWSSGRHFGGLGILSCLGLFLATGVYGAVQGGHVAGASQVPSLAFASITRAVGFRVQELRVTGATRLDGADLMQRMGIDHTTSLLAFDAQTARLRLLEDPLVKSATVRVFYPGTLDVTIAEREPFAIWQRAGQVMLIDRDGRVISPYDDIRFSHLPLVVGEGADRRVGEIGRLLDPHPAIRSRVRAAVLVAERRWTLKLGDGVDVMLPEIDPGAAVGLLARLDRDTGLLNRDIAAVDLRLQDRVVVRLTDRGAQLRGETLRARSRMPTVAPVPAPTPATTTTQPRPGRVT